MCCLNKVLVTELNKLNKFKILRIFFNNPRNVGYYTNFSLFIIPQKTCVFWGIKTKINGYKAS
jgi:hypothetical protein